MRGTVRRIVRGTLAGDALTSGLVAGAGVAALTTLAIGLFGLVIAACGLFVGAAWLAVVLRRLVSLGALCLALFVCYLWVGQPLANPAPSFQDVGFGGPNRHLPFLASIGGCLLAGLGYGTGKLLRRLWLDPPGDRSRRLTLAVSWLAIPALAGTVVVTQPAPAPQSFSFELPADWYVDPDLRGCGAYRAELDAAPGPYVDGLVTLCVDVYEAADDFTSYGPGEACFRAQEINPWESWRNAEAVPEPAIAGSVERIMARWDSGRVYGIAVGRQRWVGPIRESLCYWITVDVPVAATVTESTLNAALATFKLR